MGEKKEVGTTEGPVAGKLSYDDLETLAKQMSQENNELRGLIQNVQIDNLFKRLDYLFKVLDLSDKPGLSFGEDFIKECVEEVKLAISIPQSEGEGA